MILNKDIYERAINLIDDPDISRAYYSDSIKFQKIMYPFLVNGVSIFTMPTKVCALLASQSEPEGKIEIFDGNGTDTYTLGTTPVENADMNFYIGSTIDSGAIYNSETNSVTFSSVVPVGTTCSVEWYFGGGFTGNFSSANGKMSLSSLQARVIDILARTTVISWADKEKNFLLDIRNLLTDTDFQLHSPASSLNSKVNWVQDLRFEVFNLQNKLDWDLRNQNRSYYGY